MGTCNLVAEPEDRRDVPRHVVLCYWKGESTGKNKFGFRAS